MDLSVPDSLVAHPPLAHPTRVGTTWEQMEGTQTPQPPEASELLAADRAMVTMTTGKSSLRGRSWNEKGNMQILFNSLSGSAAPRAHFSEHPFGELLIHFRDICFALRSKGNSELKLNTFLCGRTSWSLINAYLQQAFPKPDWTWDSHSGSFIGLVPWKCGCGFFSFMYLFI